MPCNDNLYTQAAVTCIWVTAVTCIWLIAVVLTVTVVSYMS